MKLQFRDAALRTAALTAICSIYSIAALGLRAVLFTGSPGRFDFFSGLIYAAVGFLVALAVMRMSGGKSLPFPALFTLLIPLGTAVLLFRNYSQGRLAYETVAEIGRASCRERV